MRDPGLHHAWRRATNIANGSSEAKLSLNEESGGDSTTGSGGLMGRVVIVGVV